MAADFVAKLLKKFHSLDLFNKVEMYLLYLDFNYFVGHIVHSVVVTMEKLDNMFDDSDDGPSDSDSVKSSDAEAINEHLFNFDSDNFDSLSDGSCENNLDISSEIDLQPCSSKDVTSNTKKRRLSDSDSQLSNSSSKKCKLSDNHTNSQLLGLPRELLELIISYIPYKDTCKIRMVRYIVLIYLKSINRTLALDINHPFNQSICCPNISSI